MDSPILATLDSNAVLTSDRVGQRFRNARSISFISDRVIGASGSDTIADAPKPPTGSPAGFLSEAAGTGFVGAGAGGLSSRTLGGRPSFRLAGGGATFRGRPRFFPVDEGPASFDRSTEFASCFFRGRPIPGNLTTRVGRRQSSPRVIRASERRNGQPEPGPPTVRPRPRAEPTATDRTDKGTSGSSRISGPPNRKPGNRRPFSTPRNITSRRIIRTRQPTPTQPRQIRTPPAENRAKPELITPTLPPSR